MDEVTTVSIPEQPEQRGPRQTLGDLAEGGYPVVRLSEGAHAVTLTTGPDGVELLSLPAGETRTEQPDRPVTVITDPAVQAALLRQAIPVLAKRATDAQLATAALNRVHVATLAAIRRYAITRHTDGEICRDGLDKFLAAFDLDPYNPRLRISYTITGSYDLDSVRREHAERDGRNYLRVDHSSLDDFVDGSGEHTVSIDTIDTV